MNSVLDFGQLVVECLGTAFRTSKLNFSASLSLGAVLAVGCWWFCGITMRLWNKGFRLKARHHALCAFAGALTMISVVLFNCCSYLKTAADTLISRWRSSVGNERAWEMQVFAKIYHDIKKQGREDFSQYPPPEAGGTTVPDGHQETRTYISSTWGAETVRLFKERHPFLALLLPVNPEKAAARAHADYTRFRETRGNSIRYEFLPNSARIASEDILAQLTSRTTRLVLLGKTFLVLTIVLLQTAAYAFAARSAYQDLKVRV